MPLVPKGLFPSLLMWTTIVTSSQHHNLLSCLPVTDGYWSLEGPCWELRVNVSPRIKDYDKSKDNALKEKSTSKGEVGQEMRGSVAPGQEACDLFWESPALSSKLMHCRLSLRISAPGTSVSPSRLVSLPTGLLYTPSYLIDVLHLTPCPVLLPHPLP